MRRAASNNKGRGLVISVAVFFLFVVAKRYGFMMNKGERNQEEKQERTVNGSLLWCNNHYTRM